MLTIELAKKVVAGDMKLAAIRETFGSDFASLVYTETINRSWQKARWVRRVR
jgi:hypothetical protein